ncbi:hypothetical protein FJT64_012554 [Amphibalanus amphitrite]|uniref:Secreted protein n=1 Tax=Amphibalanus amphitrite TaxID=1232801 RepID=A0A6A4VI58_AMPAM|nr:hypothetical protein FJT64_012554 [Amphibalanus amphitrite]
MAPTVTAVVVLQLLCQGRSWVIDGRSVPEDSSYDYHEERPAAGAATVRRYLLHEQRPRTYLMCPQRFAIEKVGAHVTQS